MSLAKLRIGDTDVGWNLGIETNQGFFQLVHPDYVVWTKLAAQGTRSAVFEGRPMDGTSAIEMKSTAATLKMFGMEFKSNDATLLVKSILRKQIEIDVTAANAEIFKAVDGINREIAVLSCLYDFCSKAKDSKEEEHQYICDHVVQFYGWHMEEIGDTIVRISLYLEYINGEQLETALQHLSEKPVTKEMVQTLQHTVWSVRRTQSLLYKHVSISHGDLHDKNVMLERRLVDDKVIAIRAVLIDFGVACVFGTYGIECTKHGDFSWVSTLDLHEFAQFVFDSIEKQKENIKFDDSTSKVLFQTLRRELKICTRASIEEDCKFTEANVGT